MILLKKIYNLLKNQNTIQLKGKSSIERAGTVKGSTLKGEIILGEGSRIKYAELVGSITIGRFTNINGPNVSVLANKSRIQIGNFCSIAKDVLIQEYNHPIDKLSTYYFQKNIFKVKSQNEVVSKGPIVVGHDVWIGAKAIILSGVEIGNGAIVAAGSIVTKNVPPFAIVGGNPAKIIKYRFSESRIKEIENLEWWNWSIEKLNNSKELFL